MEKNALLATVLDLLPRTVDVGAEQPEDIIKRKCKLLIKKMPKDFDIKAIKKQRPVVYMESMNTVL
jgi:dynein heavy chain